MAGNSGGPWGGGGGNKGGDDDRRNNGGGRRPGEEGGPQIPEIDELMRKGQEQLRVLMGGRGGRGGQGGGGEGGPRGPLFTKSTVGLGVLAAVGLWAFSSFYTVRPEEQSVELFLGEFYKIGNPGLNFAPWPLVTAEIVNVTSERTEDVGQARGNRQAPLRVGSVRENQFLPLLLD